MMQRRDFLRLSGQAALFLGTGPSLISRAWAAPAGTEPWFFLQIHHSGGWDVTLGTDPWLGARPDEAEMFIEYDPAGIERAGNIAFGPSMLPLKPFADRMAVVNGIFMSESDNGHEAAENYILSGSTSQSWGLLPVEVLETRPSKLLGILHNQGVYAGSRSPVLTNLNSLRGLHVTGAEEPFVTDQDQGNRLSEIAKELSSSDGNLKELADILSRFAAAGEQLEDAHYLAAGFASGLSQLGLLRLTENLDSHASHPTNHLNSQKSGWEKVAQLLRVFESVELGSSGRSLLDRTTIFITSEFARTAALNTSQGKDHNPMTNSVVLLGPGLKGNQVVGGSHLVPRRRSRNGMSYHIASPIDPATGRALDSRENAMILRPENLAATVVELLGISRRRFGSVSPKAASLTSILKK